MNFLKAILVLAALATTVATWALASDLNGDGFVNRNDYDLLAAAIVDGSYVATYDLDGNGELDAVDSNCLLDDANYQDTYVSKKTYTVNGVSFTMIGVEGGTFTMGATAEQGSDYDDDERPTHQVTLSDYWIGETEVTEALWTAVMGSNPSYYKRGDNYPVEQVSWNVCQAFISKLNELTGETFRLPTEAEWEFAARGGTMSRGYKYSGSNTVGDVAWYYEKSDDKKHPVATKAANELGLYDMSGNVYEWCQDWYDDYSSAAQTNPTGPSTGSNRVCRGGSRNNRGAWDCRVSSRGGHTPSYAAAYSNFGLRLAR